MYISWCFSVLKIAKQNTRNRWFLAFFGNFYTFSKFPRNNGHLLLRKHPALEESLIWGQPISKNCHVFYRRSFPKDIKTIWHSGKIAWMLCIVYRLLEDILLYKYSHIFCHSGRYKAYMPKKVFYKWFYPPAANMLHKLVNFRSNVDNINFCK